jgi:hypothetical protein
MNYRRWKLSAVILGILDIVVLVIYFSGIPVTTAMAISVVGVGFFGIYLMISSFKKGGRQWER